MEIDTQFLQAYYPVDLVLRKYIIFLKTIEYRNTWRAARKVPYIIETSIKELLRLLYQFLDYMLHIPKYVNHDISLILV